MVYVNINVFFFQVLIKKPAPFTFQKVLLSSYELLGIRVFFIFIVFATATNLPRLLRPMPKLFLPVYSTSLLTLCFSFRHKLSAVLELILQMKVFILTKCLNIYRQFSKKIVSFIMALALKELFLWTKFGISVRACKISCFVLSSILFLTLILSPSILVSVTTFICFYSFLFGTVLFFDKIFDFL